MLGIGFELADAQNTVSSAATGATSSFRPVVASDVGGLPELIVDGFSGLLVPPGDSKALAAVLGRLMADPQLQSELAQQGRRRVDDLFEMNRNGEALAEAYAAAGLL